MKGSIEKNKKTRKMVDKYQQKRTELRNVVRDLKSTSYEKVQAMLKLSALPRNSLACRVRNMCLITGRFRAYFRKFGLGRHALREAAEKGLVPGFYRKS